jgi:hypothetical protein
MKDIQVLIISRAGEGVAQNALLALYETKNINPEEVQSAHATSTRNSASIVRNHIDEEGKYENGAIHLGLRDVADVLGPRVDKAIKDLEDSLD